MDDKQDKLGGWLGPESPYYRETMALLKQLNGIIENSPVAPNLTAADRASVMTAAVANWAIDRNERQLGAELFVRWAMRLVSGETISVWVAGQG